tara:strand:+ start:339 stop:656 length:318 start_codon:yes stop_codon:yes gene_type:complete
MEKFFLFTNGGGMTDPLNFDRTEAILLPLSNLTGIRPTDSRTITMFFEGSQSNTSVNIKIKNRSHVKIMSLIGTTIYKSEKAIITIGDVGTNRYIHPDIYDVVIN